MAHFVLVHGAWHGAWCWSRVLPLLRHPANGHGHTAHAVTLTGVGERAHLLSRDITLETHIADVVNLIEAEELSDVILAVHSYAGMIGTAVADRMPKRLKHLVYVDACIPEPGESWSSRHAPATKEARVNAGKAHPLNAFPPPDPAIFGLSGADHAWVARRQTPHPAEPYTHTLDFDTRRVASVPRTFVGDAQFWNGVWKDGAHIAVMATGHDPMVSAPAELADVLLHCAE
jgi:pimeloyl-ACP methyl ester carboxylesterase